MNLEGRMRNVICFFVLTVCFCGTGSAAKGAEEGNGSLHVVVMDSSGAVIPNASIRVGHWEMVNGAPPTLKEDSSARADQYGSYTITLKPGTYDVFVSFSIFTPVAKKVKIESGKPAEFSPKLEIDPLEKSIKVQVTC
jgi:hypothetical protein